MRLIGLAGAAGAGKDTVAELLAERHGWAVFSFSDALYCEVARAFGVMTDALRDRETKEAPDGLLMPRRCADLDARAVLIQEAGSSVVPCSPRWVLQRWGTAYRRAQDPDYWLRRASERLAEFRAAGYPGAANTSVRFDNEVDWVRCRGGRIVHVRRPGYGPANGYESEQPLPVRPGDVVLSNDGTIEQLYEAIRHAEILD